MSLGNCKIIELAKIADPRGNLTFIEDGSRLPFKIRRVYYLYDVPAGATRAGHGHKKLEQVMIAISGSFDVDLDDGFARKKYHLNRPYRGLYISSMVWRETSNFSSGSVCLVVASELFDESDYYRNYEDFLKAARTTR
jgi:hypothetical protein